MTVMMGLKCAKAKESGHANTVPAIFATSSLLVGAFCAYRLAVPVKPKQK
jgi:hypothetical protein